MVTLKVSGDLNLPGGADSKLCILSDYTILAEYLRFMVMHRIPLCIWAVRTWQPRPQALKAHSHSILSRV